MNKGLLLALLVLTIAASSASGRTVPNGCPPVANDAFGLCVDGCSNGCAKGWICCPNGCGRFCYDPATGKSTISL